MLKLGLERPIEEDDIYNVTDTMRSSTNTETLTKLWDIELQKKQPSVLRIIMKAYGFKALIVSLLYSIGSILCK